MPSPGSESAMVLSAETGSPASLVMDFHVGIEHLVEIEDFDASADGHAHRVANEVAEMVIGEKLFVLGE